MTDSMYNCNTWSVDNPRFAYSHPGLATDRNFHEFPRLEIAIIGLLNLCVHVMSYLYATQTWLQLQWSDAG